MKNDTKFIFIVLKERNGEYEYLHRSVHELSNSKRATAEQCVQSYLKGFYGGDAEAGDGGYYFFNGEIFVEESSWSFINEEVFHVLKQYL